MFDTPVVCLMCCRCIAFYGHILLWKPSKSTFVDKSCQAYQSRDTCLESNTVGTPLPNKHTRRQMDTSDLVDSVKAKSAHSKIP